MSRIFTNIQHNVFLTKNRLKLLFLNILLLNVPTFLTFIFDISDKISVVYLLNIDNFAFCCIQGCRARKKKQKKTRSYCEQLRQKISVGFLFLRSWILTGILKFGWAKQRNISFTIWINKKSRFNIPKNLFLRNKWKTAVLCKCA